MFVSGPSPTRIGAIQSDPWTVVRRKLTRRRTATSMVCSLGIVQCYGSDVCGQAGQTQPIMRWEREDEAVYRVSGHHVHYGCTLVL